MATEIEASRLLLFKAASQIKNSKKSSYFSAIAKYKASEKVAYEVLVENKHKDVVPNNTLFFHNLTVDPMWPYKQVAKIGNHIFYSKTKKEQEEISDDMEKSSEELGSKKNKKAS